MNIQRETIYIKLYDTYEKKVVTKPLEELVKELVAWSMPLSFHIAALKSQSIIMRTTIVKRLKTFEGRGSANGGKADLSMEEFQGLMKLEEYEDIWGKDYPQKIKKLNEAVSHTEGMLIFFNNKPIDARFHTVCGGSTENSENVDGNIVQYLRKVLCKYCQNTPYSFNHKDIAIKDVEKKLGVKFPKETPVNTMEISKIFYDVKRDETGRMISLKVGEKEFQGRQFVELMELNSTRFSWLPETIRFFTRGKGDGVGLCQYGANEMGSQGKTAEEILKYYYTGIAIKKIEAKDIKNPLRGKTIMIDAAHGGEKGEDNVGLQGLREKDVNLHISLSLERKLKELGATVLMTRRGDHDIPITERADNANKLLPNFFISIHQNHFKHPSISGTEIYYYRGDEEAKKLGETIVDEISATIQTINRGVKTADFFLLRDIKVSSLHVEVAYISNPQEEKLLMEEDAREKVAEAICNAIVKYYGYPLQIIE
ncbi:MAG: N-acetylmuramoyl-L-alanine amidase [Clostridiaceae bacterium]|nr:N-acetylmuramoyl-L-alanine amidase [Clostridiaceae bacterium]